MGVHRALIVSLALLLAGSAAESQAALRAPVRYEKSGGFAGVVQKLTIRADGSGVVSGDDGRREFRLPAARRRALERAVVTADLAHTKNPKPGDGADAFQYSVSYGPHKVTWDDLGGKPPERVQQLTGMLEDIYDRYAP